MYLITNTCEFFYTTDTGRSWNHQNAPKPPCTFGAQVLHFYPEHSDWIIWTGDEGCIGGGNNCQAKAYFSRDHGQMWTLVETYVRNCTWVRDRGPLVGPSQTLCGLYRNKMGSQRLFCKT